jgi:autotransporter-associated beta strand protein
MKETFKPTPTLSHRSFRRRQARRLLHAALGGALMTLAAGKTVAGTVTMTASDTSGTTSFNAGLHWDSGAAPAAGNNYFTGAYNLRTPGSGYTAITFAGDSLTLSPGGALYDKISSLSVTVNVLTNTGRIVNAQGGGFTMLGNMYVPAANGAMDTGSGNSSGTDNRNITNLMTMFGTGILTNTTTDGNWPSANRAAMGTVVYKGDATAFTGSLQVLNNTLIQANSQTNLAGNPASFNAAQLLLNLGQFQPLVSMSLGNPNGGITIGSLGGRFIIPSGISLTNTAALAGTGTLTLTNTGTLVQAGVATNFTGTLAVNAGTLLLPAGGSLAGSNTVSIGAGAQLDATAAGLTLASGQTLAGTGAVLGTVTAGAGSVISPAGAGSVGALTNGGLSFTGNATLLYDFTSTTNDIVVVTGNLTPGGVTKVQLNSSPSANGTYTLITVDGTLGGTAANFQVAALSTRTKSYAISYDSASTPKRVLLTVTGSGSAGNLVWQGDGANNLWDITTTSDWLSGASADVYYDGDTVNFTDAGAANQPVLNVTVNPAAVIFTNTTAYNLTGAGAIAGSASVSKSGSGTASLGTANSYTGSTVVTGGVLQIGATNALGSPSGSTALATVSGAGTLDINGYAVDASTFSGYNKALQISGAGSSSTQGAIDCSSGGTKLSSGGGDVGVNNVVLQGDATVSASGGNWQIGGGGLGITGNNRTLTKIGNYSLYLRAAAVNSLSNLVIAQGGVLFYDRADSLGSKAIITLTNGGMIDTWNPATYYNGLTFGNPIVVSDPVNGGVILNSRAVTWNHPPYDIYNGSVMLNGPLLISNVSYFSGTATFGKVTINGNISGTGSIIVQGDRSHYLGTGSPEFYGGNVVVFNGNNSYSGPTLVTNLIRLLTSTANQSGGAYDVVDYATLDIAQAPGRPTMPMRSLVLETSSDGPANLSFARLTSLSSSPVLYVTNLTINAGVIFPPVAGYSVGQFPLIKYEGVIGGAGFAGLQMKAPPAGVTAVLVDNAANHTIDLLVTSTGIRWAGTNSSSWDVGSTANWYNPKSDAIETYSDGETVVFDDHTTNFLVNITQVLQPSGITVNSTNDYLFVGNNSISNDTALIKSGSGTLQINCSNNVFTGGTYINGGTLKLGDMNYAYPYGGGALNNSLGTVSVTSGGTFDVNGIQVPNYQSYSPEGYNVFVSGAGFNGDGALVNNSATNNDNADAGYVTLTGDATVGGLGDLNIRHGVAPQLISLSPSYTLTKVGAGAFRLRYLTTVSTNFGDVRILNGIVSYESTSSTGLGDPTKTIYVGNGAGFALGSYAGPFSKQFVCSNGSALYGWNTASNVIATPVSLVGGTVTLCASNLQTLTFSNVISGPASVVVAPQSYIRYAAANTYTGNTTVAGGSTGSSSILRLIGSGSIETSPSIILQGTNAGATVAAGVDPSARTNGTLTLVSGQTLQAGAGSFVIGNLSAASGATLTLSGGSSDYFSVSNNLFLLSGSTTVLDINTDTLTNDIVAVGNAISYGGTLQIVKNGTASLAAGQAFRLFKSTVSSNNFASISGAPGTGLAWSFNPTNGVATVVATMATTGTNLVSTVSGNQLTLTWPGSHQGWYLQSQTNPIGIGLSNNWVDVQGSSLITQKVITLNPADGAVFYRLHSTNR